MELIVQITFDELVQAIKRLPPEQRKGIQEILQANVSFAQNREERKFGTMKGLITYMADDFDAPLDEFNEYM